MRRRQEHRQVPVVIDTESLRLSPTARLFEGARHGGVGLSMFLVDYAPGTGARLHVHPHPEVFVIESGAAMFTVGGEEIEARAGQIVIAPANTPHRFLSIGATPLHAVNIVPSATMTFTWLESVPEPPTP